VSDSTDTANEKLALGSIVAYPPCAPDVFRVLRPQHFTVKAHRLIYEAMLDHNKRGLLVDPPLIAAQLKSHPEFAGDDLAGYLMILGKGVETITHAGVYANNVLEAALKLQIRGVGEFLVDGADNGHTSDQLLRAAWADLDDLRKERSNTKPKFPLITALELATSQFVLNYLIDRVLVEKQPCILGGPKKSLKTTLAIFIAICIALGRDLFGKFSVHGARRVLVCSAESGMATIQETARRICKSLGVDLAKLENLVFTSNVPKPNDTASWTEFRAALEESGAEVLILDPFYRMFDGDGQESIFKMGAVLGTIDELCQELGVTLILCHHLKTSRLNQFAPAELDDLAYAGCAEYFRQWLLLARREAYEPGSGHHRLWLTIGGSAGHNSLWAVDIDEGRADDPGGRHWATTIQRSDEAREAAEERKVDAKSAAIERQLEADRIAACRVLAKNPNGLTKTAIGERAGIPTRRWPKVFAEMFDAGQLVECQVTVSNHKKPITGYQLGDTTNDPV
jgi:AAA domain/DnaB-like helicase N terminal domain